MATGSGTAQERELIEDLLRPTARTANSEFGPAYINPDGPAAAAALQSRIAEVGRLEAALREARGWLGLWGGDSGALGEVLETVDAALSLQRRV